jgi:hypothetical protein
MHTRQEAWHTRHDFKLLGHTGGSGHKPLAQRSLLTRAPAQ